MPSTDTYPVKQHAGHTRTPKLAVGRFGATLRRVPTCKIALASLLVLSASPHLGAIGLTQVHETEPYRARAEDTRTDYGILALDLIFGSNYVSWYGGMHDKANGGDYAVYNWVNNGDFYAKRLGDDWHFTAALIQRSTWLSSDGATLPSYPGLNSIWIDNIFMHREKGSRWSQAVVLSPGASTDFEHFDWRLIRLPVQASATYEASPELSFEFGVAYTPDFVRTPVLPLFGVTWKPAEDWELKARFTTVTLTHRLASRTTLGVFASYDEASWMIGTKAEYAQVSYSAGTAGVEVTQGFDITDKTPAMLSLAVGGTFGDNVRLYNPNGDDLRDSVYLDGGIFLRAGLKIRF